MTLLDDLRAAERGSPELGARVLTAVTGEDWRAVDPAQLHVVMYADDEPMLVKPDPTSSTDAAISLVESKGFKWVLVGRNIKGQCEGVVHESGHTWSEEANTPALALCGTLVAATGVDCAGPQSADCVGVEG